MTDAQTPDRSGSLWPSFSPPTALRLAWLCWCVLGVIPFFLALWLIWHLSGGAAAPHPPHPLRNRWFLGPMIYLILVVPASLFWRGRVFKPYWSGRTVPPGKYLLGMLAIWLALDLGGLLSLLGCVVTGSLLPNLLPALLTLMFFLTTWPSGRAMVRTVGQHTDPQVYEEPR